MTNLLTLLALTLALATTGCTGLSGIAKALSEDPAFVTVDVKTLYGSGRLVRDGRPANGNTISTEGAVSSIQPSPNQWTQQWPSYIITNIVVTNITIVAAPATPVAKPIPPRRERVRSDKLRLQQEALNPGAPFNPVP